MKENDIDKKFKVEKEGEYLEPPAFIWEDLEHDLKKNKRKKRFFAWWLAGLVLVGGMSTYLFQKINLVSGENTELATSSQTEIDPAESLDLKSNKIKNETNLKSEQTRLLTNEVEDKNTQKSEIKSKTSSSSIKIESIHADKEIDNSYINSEKQIKGNEAYNTSSKTPLFKNDMTNLLLIASNEEAKIIKQNTNPEKSQTVTTEKTENDFLIRNHLIISNLKGGQLNLFQFSRDIKNPIPIYSKLVKIHPKKLNTIAISMHIGRPIFSNVLNNEENTYPESDWFSYGLGVNYHREITDRLYFGSAVNFRRSKRKFNYQSEEISIQGYEQRLSLPPIPLQYGKLISEGEQLFSFLDLSLGFKYDVWSKRIKVRIGLAALLNLQLRSDGKVLDNDLSIIRYTNNDNLYQSKLSFGYSPSVTIDIPIYKNFNFTLSPNFTTYFQNIDNEQLIRKMNYSNVGIDLGLNKKF